MDGQNHHMLAQLAAINTINELKQAQIPVQIGEGVILPEMSSSPKTKFSCKARNKGDKSAWCHGCKTKKRCCNPDNTLQPIECDTYSKWKDKVKLLAPLTKTPPKRKKDKQKDDPYGDMKGNKMQKLTHDDGSESFSSGNPDSVSSLVDLGDMPGDMQKAQIPDNHQQFKLIYQNEYRRFNLPKPTLDDFRKLVASILGVPMDTPLRLAYKDEQADEIVIGTELEFTSACDMYKGSALAITVSLPQLAQLVHQ